MSKADDLLAAIEKVNYTEVHGLLTKYKLIAFAESHRDKGAYQILCKAISKKDLSIISMVLTKFPKVNFALGFGPPPLFEAVLSGQEVTVKLLLDKGAEIRVKCTEHHAMISPSFYCKRGDKTTALHLAAREGYLEIVKLLLRRGADIHDKDSSQETPLHVSVKHPLVVEYLLSKGARNDVPSHHKRTPLHNAVSSECLESVKLLISHGANVKFEDSSNQTPLHLAVKNIEISTYLLQRNARITNQDGNGNSPLHRAVSGGSIDVVKLLIKHGANIEAENSTLQRPLHLAAYKRDSSFVEVILNAGAIVSVKDNSGDSPLILAVKRNSLESVKLLVDKEGTIDDQHGKQLLKIAAKISPDIVEYFMRKGIGVSASNESEQTTLYLAAVQGLYGTVEVLLRNGARLCAEHLQRDIAQIARKSGPGILKLILNAYPDVRFRNDDEQNIPFQIGTMRYLENAISLIQRGANVNDRFYLCYPRSILNKTALMHALKEEDFTQAESVLAAGADINATSSLKNVEMTPLYQALSQPKNKAVEWCLKHGADVNLLPENWDATKYQKTMYHASVRQLIRYLAIIKHQQLEVDERLMDLVNSFGDFVEFKSKCDKEIAGLVMDKFSDTVTVFDVLVASSNRLASYARNENFAQGLKKKKYYGLKYRIYGNDISAQAKKGIDRRKVLNEACQFSRVLFPGLPQMIVDMVFSYLGENDLSMVIDTCKTAKKSKMTHCRG